MTKKELQFFKFMHQHLQLRKKKLRNFTKSSKTATQLRENTAT